RIGVLGDHQAGSGEVDLLFSTANELAKVLEAHAAPRREKSRRRKPKARSEAPYVAVPRRISPTVAGTLSCQGAPNHQEGSPMVVKSTMAIRPTANPTFRRKTGQPGWGA